MLTFWAASLVAVFATLTAILAAALDRDVLLERRNESLTFLRLVLVGLFGALIGQTFNPAELTWWVSALLSIGLSLFLLFGSQLLARRLARTGFDRWLTRITGSHVKYLDHAFTPFSTKPVELTDEFEQELLESVDEFGETITREVMVPRVDMAVIEADQSLESAISDFLSTGYSRLPVIGKNVDDVLGILYLKDVTRVMVSNPASMATLTANAKARAATFVPESKPVDDLLREMQKSSTHIAIVVDEYGGVAGLVTMEDVIEEIVGDISDEYDRDVADVTELGNGKLSVSAKYSLFDLGERFGLELEDEDVDSVGGLLSKQLGRLPIKGDSVLASGLKLTAERFEGRPKRLMRILVEPTEDLLEAQTAFEGDE